MNLLESCRIVPGAIVSKPVLDAPEGRAVLFAMDAGQVMSEHRAPFLAAVHVLDGRLTFTVAGQQHDLGPHTWLAMPVNAAHSLTALEPTRFLLTLFKPSASR